MEQRNDQAMSAVDFKGLGGGRIAYVRPIMSEQLATFFPQAPRLAPGTKLWALLNADGSPILIADSKAVAEANAAEHDLETVSLH